MPCDSGHTGFMRHFILPILLATAGVIFAAEPPQHIDVSKLPGQATVVDNVIVPVPSEIFGVLDKLGSPNWHEVLRPTRATPSGDRAQVALELGVVIAEGFIAVEAQEGEEVKKIGRSVLNLSAAVGVRKSVTARSNAIIEAADKKDWETVRNELDRALQDVKEAMIELHDEQLAQLVSLGGWLRGLLHQPALLDFFQRRLDGLEPRLQKDALVANIQKKLTGLKPLMSGSGADVTAKTVEQVHEITKELVKQINSKEE